MLFLSEVCAFESPCGQGAGLQQQTIFNQETAQICQRVSKEETHGLCDDDAKPPTFCVADSVANGQLMPYFFPTALNQVSL